MIYWSHEKSNRASVLASCLLHSCNLTFPCTAMLCLVCLGRTENEWRSTLLENEKQVSGNHHCTCEHLYNMKITEHVVPLYHLSAATPTAVAPSSICIPKLATVWCHMCMGHSPAAMSFRLRSSVDGCFRPGVITWLLAAISCL